MAGSNYRPRVLSSCGSNVVGDAGGLCGVGTAGEAPPIHPTAGGVPDAVAWWQIFGSCGFSEIALQTPGGTG